MRPEIATLRTLREAVEAASGPSRELDARIHGTIADEAAPWSPADLDYAASDPNRTCNPPAYTSSIDASLALSERVLPGWVVDALEDDYAGTPGSLQILGATCELTAGDDRWAQGMAATRPLAILAALLDALETRHEA